MALDEIWKEIDGYNGNYFVSNLGRLKSFKVCSKGRLLKKNINRDGYNVFTLSDNCKLKTHTIHRLVAIAFITKIKGKDFVNHIDGNKSNNNYFNLEWCTRSENQVHAYKTGLVVVPKGTEHYNSRFTNEDILYIRKSDLSESKLGAKYNVNRATIGKIKRLERYKNI